MLGPKVPPPPTPEPQLYSNLHVRTITPESSQPTQSYVFLSVHGSSEKRLDFTRIVTSEPSHPTLLPYPFLPVRCSSEKRLDLSRTVTSDPSHPTLYYITLSSRPLFIGETPRFESNRHIRTVLSDPVFYIAYEYFPSVVRRKNASRVYSKPLHPNGHISSAHPALTLPFFSCPLVRQKNASLVYSKPSHSNGHILTVHVRPLPCLFLPSARWFVGSSFGNTFRNGFCVVGACRRGKLHHSREDRLVVQGLRSQPHGGAGYLLGGKVGR